MELRNKCSGLQSPSGPPNSGEVETVKGFFPEYKLTTPDLSASQLISAENMIGLLFFNGIEVFFKPKLLWLKAANNDLSQSER